MSRTHFTLRRDGIEKSDTIHKKTKQVSGEIFLLSENFDFIPEWYNTSLPLIVLCFQALTSIAALPHELKRERMDKLIFTTTSTDEEQ